MLNSCTEHSNPVSFLKVFSPHLIDKEIKTLSFFHTIGFCIQEKYYEDEKIYSQANSKTRGFLEYIEQVSCRTFKELFENESTPVISYAKPMTYIFLKNVRQISFSTSLNVVLGKINSFIASQMQEILTPFHMNVVHLQLALPPSQLNLLGEEEKAHKIKKISFDCIHFAFYKLLEKRIFPYILGKITNLFIEEDPKHTNSETIIQNLYRWNYQLVQHPQKGDLIVYIKGNEIPHFGVMESSERVISKWGRLAILSHPIESVSPKYGDRYLLFRKGRGDGLETHLQELIDAVENSLATFSHPVCYSPRSIVGCQRILKERMICLIKKYEHDADEGPVYGKSYFKILQILFNKKVESMMFIECRKEMLQEFNKTLHESLDDIDAFQETLVNE